jgi:hypothetical protein
VDQECYDKQEKPGEKHHDIAGQQTFQKDE